MKRWQKIVLSERTEGWLMCYFAVGSFLAIWLVLLEHYLAGSAVMTFNFILLGVFGELQVRARRRKRSKKVAEDADKWLRQNPIHPEWRDD